MMTSERFHALVQAYGGDARRWPDSERAAALAFRATHPELARAVLAEADAVDDLLSRSPAPRVSVELRDRMVAAAQAGRRVGRWWIDRAAVALGAGWAAAACAGMAAGVVMTTHLTADAKADAVFYQASLLGVDDMEMLG